ncbi:hypothetical protein ACWT_4446 [Actinoplanes sp. SE50]|nr:hypothetical protein ACPL_4577 [Actinoplanes sp. SE50/110]ATO83861.1 hypothetical protein ACWT_4446 [Actinoplanes sp. SE50]SLM01271.1 hypothetical protein ACSP50_4507 [Actinoplanes sp. SE50/110]
MIVAVYAGGMLLGRWRSPADAHAAGSRQACPESTDPGHRKAETELCPLINRPEILTLVDASGTVKGISTSYDPHGEWYECTVTLPSGSLRLNVWKGRTRLADYRKLIPEAQPRTVLGRPAAWWPDSAAIQAIPVKESSVLVAWDRADTGGMVEISTIRTELDPADQAPLTRIAERQLPGLPGWPA